MGSLLTSILTGIIIYFSCYKFSYVVNSVIYAIAKVAIPIILELFLSWILDYPLDTSFSFWGIIVSIIIYFLMGALFLKLIDKLDLLDDCSLQSFALGFAFFDYLICKILGNLFKLVFAFK